MRLLPPVSFGWWRRLSQSEEQRSRYDVSRLRLGGCWCRRLCGLALLALIAGGCSPKRLAMNTLANSLSGGGSSVYLTDDDPVLVGEALPFGLKLMETVLQGTPDHQGLLVATASGFVMYSHAFVLREARVRETTDPVGARGDIARAKALFLRGRRYAGRALEARHRGILGVLVADPSAAVRPLKKADVPAMYWYAAAHGSATAADKSDMGLVADFPLVPALLDRALELDEGWSSGAIHELLVVVSASEGTGGAEQAEHHFQRAMELNGGRSVAPLVSLAQSVCVQQQDRRRFEELLNEVLAFDLDSAPELRLSNTLAQEQAAWLLDQIDALFIEAPDDPIGIAWISGGETRWLIRD
jgi:predicted anti-sigma-YlaC factor YlaD